MSDRNQNASGITKCDSCYKLRRNDTRDIAAFNYYKEYSWFYYEYYFN